jgi:hypothetical protein
MSAQGRPARWWEVPELNNRDGRQGRLVSPAGRSCAIPCPKCGAAPVVYNGNYFCDNWNYPAGPDDCDWAQAHPSTTKRDRDFCDLVGLDYS